VSGAFGAKHPKGEFLAKGTDVFLPLIAYDRIVGIIDRLKRQQAAAVDSRAAPQLGTAFQAVF